MKLEPIALTLLSTSLLFVWLPKIWDAHKRTAMLWTVIQALLAAVYIYVLPGILSGLFAVVALYQIGNLQRVIRNRMQPNFLYRATLRTSLYLSLIGVTIGLFGSLLYGAGRHDYAIGLGVAIAQVVAGLILFTSTQRHLGTTKTLQVTTAYKDRDLPALSVLIPARNETTDLQHCLEALIASNYPKLEIIVLDDCSQNKHTPEIIRSFAHDGVRFIAGEVPADNWLAKNYAYEQLARTASGDYLLFCGVDLRVSVDALRELITTMLEKDKSMLSVLPHNSQPEDWRTFVVQPMRYMWELSLPRRLFNRPPVLSTCWLIKRSALAAAGSFKAASRSIAPESYFARSCARGDGYSFVRSNMVVSSKSISEQFATTVRIRYPQLRRRPESVLVLAFLEVLCIILPALVMVLGFMSQYWLIGGLSALAFVLFAVVYAQVAAVMYGRIVLLGSILVPIVLLYDVIMLHYSMYRYEFQDVHWKERNICLPIMYFDAGRPTPPLPNRG